MAIRSNLLVVLFLSSVGTVLGQPRTITLHPVDVSGKIAQIGQRSIFVKSANGQNWTLNLHANTKIKITGSAEPDMLTPGTCVRFMAQIDKRTCKGQGKIDKVTLFSLTPGVAERTLGVELASEHPQENEQDGNGEGPMPGPPGRGPGPMPGKASGRAPADPGILGDAPAGGKSPKRRAGAKGPDKLVPDVAAYDVCAQLVSYRGGRMTVTVHNRFFKPRIAVELSPDAQIDLDLGNLSLAKASDNISATGYYITPGICEAGSIEVALTNPLGSPGSRSHRPRAAVHAGDTVRRAAGTTKPVAATGKNAAADKAPAKEAADGDISAKNHLPENDHKSARTESKTKPETPPPRDLTPPSDDGKSQAKKLEKKPPVQDDDKDVFDK
jgi:hypothetical protein